MIDARGGVGHSRGRLLPPEDRPCAKHGDQPAAHKHRDRRQRTASVREIAGRSLLPAHRREARIMIATIKAEWRKSRFRPAFLVTAGIITKITILIYLLSWY